MVGLCEAYAILYRIGNQLHTKTYVYDKKEKYVIVLECQRKSSYYLLTAYYLNKEYAEKGIKKKMKKRLPNIE